MIYFLPISRAGVLCLALPITIDGTSWGKVVGWCMVGAGNINNLNNNL